MTTLDETEYANLERAMIEAEHVVSTARLSGTPAPIELTAKLAETEKRMGILDENGLSPERREEKKSALAQDLAVAVMVEREIALSRQEKDTLSGFLRQYYFRKRDFDALAVFYENSWDKLSEEGKDEMSERIWNGVHHGEYRFEDLPSEVSEREAQWLYHSIENDREKMIRATGLDNATCERFADLWKSGRKAESYQMLSESALGEYVSKTQQTLPNQEILSETVNAQENVDTAKKESSQNTGGAAGIPLSDGLLARLDTIADIDGAPLKELSGSTSNHSR